MKRGLPQDPMLAQLVQMARQHQISRRTALAGVGGTAAALSLASCAAAEETVVAATDLSDSEKVLSITVLRLMTTTLGTPRSRIS